MQDGSGGVDFIGREIELEQLLSALSTVVGGQGVCRLIAGEPGIGKSRLVAELVRRAREQATATVLWGRAWEAGGAPPYWTWTQALRPLADDRSLLDRIGPNHRPFLARLMPIEVEVDPNSAVNLDEEGVRFRLFEAVAELLRGAAQRQPLMLVLEDMDAADLPSQLLLRFVGEITPTTRLLLVVTYRDVALARKHPLRGVVAALLRSPYAGQLVLRGLSPSQIADWMSAVLERPPDLELAARIHRETDGNPLFVGELLRLLSQQPTRAPLLEQLEMPDTVREAIERRLEQIPERLRATLATAAVVGRDFTPEVLGDMTGLASADLLSSIDEGVEDGLIVEVPDRPGRFRFRHILIRDALYDQLPPSGRATLHLAAAAALERSYAVELESHAAELAHHHMRAGTAGDFRLQVHWTRRAADRATRSLAYEEAARLLHQAVEVLARGQDEKTRCEVLLEMGDAEARAGDAPSARERFLAAAQLAEQLGLPEYRARAALGYGGRFVWEAGRGDPHLVTLLRGALEALGTGDEALRARLLARLGGGPLRDDPARDERDRLTAEAISLARMLDDAGLLAYTLNARYAAVWWPDNLGERLELARELVDSARRAGDREHELQAHHYLCLALLEAGDIVGSEYEAAEQKRLADELRQPAQLLYVATVEAMLATLRGEFDKAEELISSASASGQRAEPTMARIYRIIQLHSLRRVQGRLNEIVGEVERAVADLPTYVVLRAVLADTLVQLGRPDEARRLLIELAAHDFATLPMNDEWLFAMCLLAEAAAQLHERESAEVIHRLLDAYAGRVAVSAPDSCLGSVDRVLGLLDERLGRMDEARQHTEAGLALNEALGSPSWVVTSQVQLARLLLVGDDDDRVRARRLLQEAVLAARTLGMPVLEAQASDLLGGTQDGPSGERLTRTFLFTDIVRSTDLVEAIGDEAWQDVLGWHDRTLRGLLEAHGALLTAHHGDGFFAVFDEPAKAVACAMGIQQTLANHRRSHGFAPRVRIGVHQAEARLVNGNYMGQGVHAAARIGALAGAGEVLASLSTVSGLDDLSLGPTRTEQLKGLREPLPLVALQPAGAAEP